MGQTYSTRRELNEGIGLDISVLDFDESLAAIFVAIRGDKALELIDSYSPKSHLNTIGAPSALKMSLGIYGEIGFPNTTNFTLSSYYDNEGILIQQFGIATKKTDYYQVCLGDPATNGFSPAIHFLLFDPKILSLQRAYQAFGGALEMSYDLEEITGSEPSELINRMLTANDPVCLEIPFED
jgi:hypothetical protein